MNNLGIRARIGYCFIYFFLLLSSVLSSEVCAVAITVVTSKPAYYRYELVDITVRFDDTDDHSVVVDTVCASVFTDSSSVSTIAGMKQIPCLYNKGEMCWEGYWPIPWNPPLGSYSIEAEILTAGPSSTHRVQTSFEIIGKPHQPLDPGFCAMTIESTIDFLTTPFPSPTDDSMTKDSFLTWARFLGADAVWYSVGQTMEGKPGVTDETPWYPLNVSLFPKVAAMTKEAGFKFGGWIGCYFLWGEKVKQLQYNYSWDYWEPTGRMYRPHRVSISDEKRLSDIIDLVRRLDNDPNVDFVGLDYIRTGFGGYEMVEDFVRKMSVVVPGKWDTYSSAEKKKWLALDIEVEKNGETVEKWQWYCAHRVASNVRTIIERADLKKPLWVFLLGWRHGQEHGQDPIMFHDAGASWCAVMLYESDAEHCREMNDAWSSYLDTGVVNLVLGESVDWELLQKSTHPPGPEEFYRRLTEAIDGFYGHSPVEGAFWHDLNRGAWGDLGPYQRIEWAIAGAAAFSHLRSKDGRLPFSARLKVPDETKVGVPFNVMLLLENRGLEDVDGIVIEPIEVLGVECIGSGPIWVGTLRSHTEASICLKCTIPQLGDGSRIQSMVATRTKWDSQRHQDQFVNFAYVHRQPKNVLTK